MSLLYPLLGVLVLAFTIVDLVWSTLSVGGGGPLSRRLGRALWRLTGRATYTGPLILLATAVVWVGLLWAGWTLVFMGAPEAVVAAATGTPAGFWERVYFGGYTVVTLGLGDFVPATPAWQLLTVLAAASGLVLITLAVTYYTAVLGAVVQKQQLAALIHALGDSPSAIVAGAWDSEGFPGLDSVLPSLASLLTLHARRHYAYPVIHFFRPRDPEEAVAVQAARLGEALLILWRVVEAENRPPPVSLRLAHRSLGILLDTLHPHFVEAAQEVPPSPDLSPLRVAGVPLDAEAPFEKKEIREERRLLLGYVRESRFRWSDVDPDAPSTTPL